MNIVQQKVRSRNITPTLLRFKRKSGTPTDSTKRSDSNEEVTQDRHNTDRSTSRASKGSLEAHQPKILHLSRLRNHLKFKNNQEILETATHRRTESTTETKIAVNLIKDRSNVASNERENYNSTRDRKMDTGFKYQLRKNTSSGRTIGIASPERRRSNSKRNQQSLEKQEQKAKQMNNQLLTNLMKQQYTPNYINKIKNRKSEIGERKKKKFLNINIEMCGQEQLKKYQILGQLGKGAYGIVKMGLNKKDQEKVAVKIYQKKRLDEPNKIKNLQREINILAELDHPTIAKLTFAIETQTQIYLILEYGGANSLYNYLLSKQQHRLTESQAKLFLKTIAQAIQYLHRRNIVHRDIKAENILLNRHRQLKLIDFGFSLYNHPENKIDTFCGTPTYMAPQIVSKMDHYPIYTDMWSLGVLFYVLLQGNYPFRAKSENELFEKIRKGQFEYIHNDISPESKNLIQSLIKVNPYERLTIEQVLSPKNRQWLTGNQKKQTK